MRSEEVTVRSSDGLNIQGVVDEATDVRAALVLCHPHPQMGGTMNAPLLVALRDRLVSEGWAVIRFNFRGIGTSQGESSTGEAEVADAEGAVSLARKRYPNVPLAIAGWSFGAAVAVRAAARDLEIAAVVGIAPAVKAKQGITAGLPTPDDIGLKAPLLFVIGANDKNVSPDECRTWAKELPAASYVEMKGANHFFWGKYDDLAETVADWLNGTVFEDE